VQINPFFYNFRNFIKKLRKTMMMTHDGCPFLYRSILILLIAFIGAYAQLYSYGDEW